MEFYPNSSIIIPALIAMVPAALFIMPPILDIIPPPVTAPTDIISTITTSGTTAGRE